jgi:hypothetical protein
VVSPRSASVPRAASTSGTRSRYERETRSGPAVRSIARVIPPIPPARTDCSSGWGGVPRPRGSPGLAKRLSITRPTAAKARLPLTSGRKGIQTGAVVTPPLPIAVTRTGEPHQPVRLYWRVKNRGAVLSVLRGLSCVWADADGTGRWLWVYDDEATSIELPKRAHEIPEVYRPIVLARVSFPAPGKMVMRFSSTVRAVAGARFFSPRFGDAAVLDRARILNRLVTAEEALPPPHDADVLLDRNVTVMDPEVEARRIEALLDAADTVAERRRVYEQDAIARRSRDVPEVEDFPLAMEEETADFTHLDTTLGLRAIRAAERWQGKLVTLREIIYRTLKVDPNAPLFPPETT